MMLPPKNAEPYNTGILLSALGLTCSLTPSSILLVPLSGPLVVLLLSLFTAYPSMAVRANVPNMLLPLTMPTALLAKSTMPDRKLIVGLQS